MCGGLADVVMQFQKILVKADGKSTFAIASIS